jgi:hypothetical protein
MILVILNIKIEVTIHHNGSAESNIYIYFTLILFSNFNIDYGNLAYTAV